MRRLFTALYFLVWIMKAQKDWKCISSCSNKTYPFPKSNHLGRKTHLSSLKTLGVHHIIQAPLETALWSCSHTVGLNLD